MTFKKLFLFILLVSFITFVGAADFTPQGNINLRDTYNITNVPEYNGTNINITGFYYGNGSQLTGVLTSVNEGNLDVNSTINWITESNGYLNDTNATEFNNVNKELTIDKSWLDTFITNVVNLLGFITWSDAQNGTLFNQEEYDTNYTANDAAYRSTTNSSYLRDTGDTATGNYTFDSGTFFIDSIRDRIGIGTATPQNTLNVVGDVNVTGDLSVGFEGSSSGKITLMSSSIGETDADISTDGAGWINLNAPTGGIFTASEQFKVSTGGTERMRVTSSGVRVFNGFLNLTGNNITNVDNIGTTSNEINNIYMATNARIYFGDNQEVSQYFNGTVLISG